MVSLKRSPTFPLSVRRAVLDVQVAAGTSGCTGVTFVTQKSLFHLHPNSQAVAAPRLARYVKPTHLLSCAAACSAVEHTISGDALGAVPAVPSSPHHGMPRSIMQLERLALPSVYKISCKTLTPPVECWFLSSPGLTDALVTIYKPGPTPVCPIGIIPMVAP